MTGKTFRLQVQVTIGLLLVVALATLISGLCWPEIHGAKFGEATRAVIPAYVAVAAGWVAYCLQRRIAYTNALRALWEKVVGSVQIAIQYTHLGNHDSNNFATVMRELSSRVDDIRGVFRNKGEIYREPSYSTKQFVVAIKAAKSIDELTPILKNYRVNKNGVYPFESLKQIQGVIDRLGFGTTVTPERAKIARRAILALWGILRSELLKELDRDYPEFPDTPYG